MTKLTNNLLASVILAAVLLAQAGAGLAEDKADNDTLRVEQPWVSRTLVTGGTSAAYMRITNTSQSSVKLIAANSDAAGRLELHTHLHENGIMRMRKVEGGIEIPAGKTVALEAGGLHLMLFGVKGKLTAGQSVSLTLEFSNGKSVRVSAPVKDQTGRNQ